MEPIGAGMKKISVIVDGGSREALHMALDRIEAARAGMDTEAPQEAQKAPQRAEERRYDH